MTDAERFQWLIAEAPEVVRAVAWQYPSARPFNDAREAIDAAAGPAPPPAPPPPPSEGLVDALQRALLHEINAPCGDMHTIREIRRQMFKLKPGAAMYWRLCPDEAQRTQFEAARELAY